MSIKVIYKSGRSRRLYYTGRDERYIGDGHWIPIAKIQAIAYAYRLFARPNVVAVEIYHDL